MSKWQKFYFWVNCPFKNFLRPTETLVVYGLHYAVCSKLEAFGKYVIILIEKQYSKSNLYGLAGCACLSQVSQWGRL